jgi:hypothetical protein
LSLKSFIGEKGHGELKGDAFTDSVNEMLGRAGVMSTLYKKETADLTYPQ